VDLTAPQVLEIMSFYKNQAVTAQKRHNNIASDLPNGFRGGGRLNYRDIVEGDRWTSTHYNLIQRYTDISIIN
jgi:hypothetical protein